MDKVIFATAASFIVVAGTLVSGQVAAAPCISARLSPELAATPFERVQYPYHYDGRGYDPPYPPAYSFYPPPAYYPRSNYYVPPPVTYYPRPEGYLPPLADDWEAARPASCGEYRYWNGEYCADARYQRPYVGPRW
jgi:hypothetical protein